MGLGVGLSSYAISNESRAPARTLALGLPPTALASSNFAVQSLAARRARDPEAGVNNIERRLAMEAYRSEPLSATSVALTAMSMTSEEQAADRLSLLQLGGQLSRRSTLVGSSLIEAAALRGDDRTFFRWISRVMLTNVDAGQVYGTALADATARNGAVDALVEILGPNPRWADLYWRLINGRPASMANAAELRIAITKNPWAQTEIRASDEGLVQGLVDNQDFDTARRLADALRPATARNEPLLVNANFLSDPRLPPFDWQLSMLGNLGASIDKKDKMLIISAVGGARGPAARQLVRLSPGSYRLGWKLASSAPLPDGLLSLRIRCADPKIDAAVLPITLTAGQHQADADMARSDCSWYWFSIDVSVPDDAGGIDANLSDLSFSVIRR
ncbi:MAG: hypothetical protein U0S50_07690 [Sphingopyxis sp.]|uniref:hypothetical protein n=1 Tax=Sphingopyxis sp. TaxID=1908224 RepID=UPI002ABAE8EB|nr:hypothetical protein [Sphingopyxis sp.]MDZ3831684.1 hypothetical protein [Sphingopyxis sp.]